MEREQKMGGGRGGEREIFTKSPASDWSTKREVKIRKLNASINLHSDTALFIVMKSARDRERKCCKFTQDL